MTISKLLSYILIGFSILLLISIFKNAIKIMDINSRIEKTKIVVSNLDAVNKKLLEIREKRGSLEFLQKQIRNKLGLVDENETLLVLPKELDIDTKEEDYINESLLIPKSKQTKKSSNWQSWLSIFY